MFDEGERSGVIDFDSDGDSEDIWRRGNSHGVRYG